MNSRLTPVAMLSPLERRAMLGLMDKHYADLDAAAFASDLDAKSHAVLVESGGHIVGFSTLVTYDVAAGPLPPVRVVFSGDTIVDHAHWGAPALLRGWLSAVIELGLLGAEPAPYWFLLAGGVRTYRMLPVFWRAFYPDPESPDAGLGALAARLAIERYGDRFDERAGVVRPLHAYALRQQFAPTGREVSNPHARYFLQRNPGCTRGDELVCLTRLHRANLTGAGQRLIRT